MAYENILYEKMRQGVLITLNRPERLNALSEELRAELHQAFHAAADDPEVRAIVLTGAGRAFSAGADMGLRADQAETIWPYGLPEGTSVAEFLDRWRTSDRLTIPPRVHWPPGSWQEALDWNAMPWSTTLCAPSCDAG